MSEIKSFSFLAEEQSEPVDVRMITHEENAPWFVLTDVLKAMMTSTPTTVAVQSIEQGLGDGFNVVIAIPDSLGRVQQTTIVAESAVTYLLSRSNTEAGRKLNRHIHVEILPSIRKTGAYVAPQMQATPVESDQVKRAIDLGPGALKLAEAFGFSGNQALLSANKLVRKHTGIDLLDSLGQPALPAPVQEALLAPSDIAVRLGISKNQTNPKLIEAGLQTSSRDHKGRLVYEPTEAGKSYAEFLDTGKSHSDGTPVRQLKWRSGVLQLLGTKEALQC